MLYDCNIFDLIDPFKTSEILTLQKIVFQVKKYGENYTDWYVMAPIYNRKEPRLKLKYWCSNKT